MGARVLGADIIGARGQHPNSCVDAGLVKMDCVTRPRARIMSRLVRRLQGDAPAEPMQQHTSKARSAVSILTGAPD